MLILLLFRTVLRVRFRPLKKNMFIYITLGGFFIQSHSQLRKKKSIIFQFLGNTSTKLCPKISYLIAPVDTVFKNNCVDHHDLMN